MAGLVVSPVSLLLGKYFEYCWIVTSAVQASGYEIDVDDWHAHVHHTLPYEKYLKRDDALRDLLQRVELPLYVFTNGDRKHAEICLRLMGITDCFKVLDLMSLVLCLLHTCIVHIFALEAQLSAA